MGGSNQSQAALKHGMPDAIDLARCSVFVPSDPFEDRTGPFYFRIAGDARRAGEEGGRGDGVGAGLGHRVCGSRACPGAGARRPGPVPCAQAGCVPRREIPARRAVEPERLLGDSLSHRERKT